MQDLDQRFSFEKLIEFLKFAGEKGLMATATAQSRTTAVAKMFDLATESEKLDVRTIDMDSLGARFQNKYKTAYNPTSLGVYKSRVTSSLTEFIRWSDNPSAYKPQMAKASNAPAKDATGAAASSKRRVEFNREQPSHGVEATNNAPPAASVIETFAVPIPLRAKLTLTLNGLPFDLTEVEAERICSVVRAYVIK